MEILPEHPDTITRAIAILKEGGVVAHATETCYGLACDMTNERAIERLFFIKDRPPSMPVSALFSSVDQAKEFTIWNDTAEGLATEHLPGALTLVLRKKPEQTLFVNLHETKQKTDSYPQPYVPSSVGIRVSSHPLSQQLIEAYGTPLSTTSANVHGMGNAYSLDDILQQYEGREYQPDLIIDSGKIEDIPGSTVVDVRGDEVKVLRQGSIVIEP